MGFGCSASKSPAGAESDPGASALRAASNAALLTGENSFAAFFGEPQSQSSLSFLKQAALPTCKELQQTQYCPLGGSLSLAVSCEDAGPANQVRFTGEIAFRHCGYQGLKFDGKLPIELNWSPLRNSYVLEILGSGPLNTSGGADEVTLHALHATFSSARNLNSGKLKPTFLTLRAFARSAGVFCSVELGSEARCSSEGEPADSDGDLWPDVWDNCPKIPNRSQVDTDGDSVGDLCDNCPQNANPDQANLDQDITGDACDLDECIRQSPGNDRTILECSTDSDCLGFVGVLGVTRCSPVGCCEPAQGKFDCSAPSFRCVANADCHAVAQECGFALPYNCDTATSLCKSVSCEELFPEGDRPACQYNADCPPGGTCHLGCCTPDVSFCGDGAVQEHRGEQCETAADCSDRRGSTGCIRGPAQPLQCTCGTCGDGICNHPNLSFPFNEGIPGATVAIGGFGTETPENCPQDCVTCPESVQCSIMESPNGPNGCEIFFGPAPGDFCDTDSGCCERGGLRSCGDKFCDPKAGEDANTCPFDCRPAEPCGDGTCDSKGGEDSKTCPQDCSLPSPVCGDDLCDTGEDADSCPQDCATASCGELGPVPSGFTCALDAECQTYFQGFGLPAAFIASIVCEEGCCNGPDICSQTFGSISCAAQGPTYCADIFQIFPGGQFTECNLADGCCQSPSSPPPPSPCGDGFCDPKGGEDEFNCPADCAIASPPGK